MRRHVNVGWTKGLGAKRLPKLPTEFELCVRRLGLTEQSCAESGELRSWCKANRNRCYIPEWLLNRWKLKAKNSSS